MNRFTSILVNSCQHIRKPGKYGIFYNLLEKILSESLLEFDDVFVVESFEYFDLSEDDAFVLLIGVILLELFDGN